MTRRGFLMAMALLAAMLGGACAGFSGRPAPKQQASGPAADTALVPVHVDSVLAADSSSRYSKLTDADFRLVAAELQVEVAAIKAVVVIEAGKEMKGFWAPGVPVVNHDRSMWGACARKVRSNKKAPANATIPAGLKAPNARRAWQKLINARKRNIDQADLSTFWGMFQIGGFNYRQCGCSSIQEFVDLMSYSELEQLELFAAMITNTGMVKYLRSKNWAAFARAYNGSSYARRGYHTRMAAAYRRFKAEGL